MIILMVCIIVKKIPINIFWFKRDLRILDNKPLYEASKKKIEEKRKEADEALSEDW